MALCWVQQLSYLYTFKLREIFQQTGCNFNLGSKLQHIKSKCRNIKQNNLIFTRNHTIHNLLPHSLIKIWSRPSKRIKPHIQKFTTIPNCCEIDPTRHRSKLFSLNSGLIVRSGLLGQLMSSVSFIGLFMPPAILFYCTYLAFTFI